jgi:hypothetical protein
VKFVKFGKRTVRATARRPSALLLGIASAAGALALAAGPVPVADAATPATVAVRSGWFGLESGNLGYCLDGNSAGSVYMNPCQVPGNHYQDWDWTEWKAYSPYSGYYYFYSIKSQGTGRCLDSNVLADGDDGDVYTNPCQAPGNSYQDWYWTPDSTPDFAEFTDVATTLSLWGFPGAAVDTAIKPADTEWKLIQ